MRCTGLTEPWMVRDCGVVCDEGFVLACGKIVISTPLRSVSDNRPSRSAPLSNSWTTTVPETIAHRRKLRGTQKREEPAQPIQPGRVLRIVFRTCTQRLLSIKFQVHTASSAQSSSPPPASAPPKKFLALSSSANPFIPISSRWICASSTSRCLRNTCFPISMSWGVSWRLEVGRMSFRRLEMQTKLLHGEIAPSSFFREKTKIRQREI